MTHIAIVYYYYYYYYYYYIKLTSHHPFSQNIIVIICHISEVQHAPFIGTFPQFGEQYFAHTVGSSRHHCTSVFVCILLLTKIP